MTYLYITIAVLCILYLLSEAYKSGFNRGVDKVFEHLEKSINNEMKKRQQTETTQTENDYEK